MPEVHWHTFQRAQFNEIHEIIENARANIELEIDDLR